VLRSLGSSPVIDHEEQSLPSVPYRLKRALCFALVLALVGTGCGSNERLEAKDLFQQLESLQSEAAEGALLAQDAADGRTTRIYTREHSTELYQAARGAEATLNAATTEPQLESELSQLRVFANRVSSALQRLATASGDEDRALVREFQAIQKLGAGLA
jgi:hypothetical protein